MKEARHRFGVQKANAKQRNIPFLLTFDEWYNWWLSQGIDKNIPNNNLDGNQLCMCRFKDNGPYSLNNIYCATRRQNTSDLRKNKKYTIYGNKGKGKRVFAEIKIFPSVKKACEFLNIKAPSFYHRMKTKPQQYYYA